MTRLFAAVCLMMTWAAGTAFAQAYPPNEAGVTMGHWHLNSRDVEANKKILVAMGGTPIKPGAFEIVRFPGVAVFLHQGPGTPPNTGGDSWNGGEPCRVHRAQRPGIDGEVESGRRADRARAHRDGSTRRS